MNSLKVSNENWRLSKIEEEEHDRMTTSTSSSSTNHSSPQKLNGEQHSSCKHSQNHPSNPLNNDSKDSNDTNLSHHFSLPRTPNKNIFDDSNDDGYEKVPQSKEEWDRLKFKAAKAEEAVKSIKSKYDSLERTRLNKEISPKHTNLSMSINNNATNNLNISNKSPNLSSINPSAIESLNSNVHCLNQYLSSRLQCPYVNQNSTIDCLDLITDNLGTEISSLNISNWSEPLFPPPPENLNMGLSFEQNLTSGLISHPRNQIQQQLQFSSAQPPIRQKEYNAEKCFNSRYQTSTFHLSEHDLLQVETFYKGHKTEVYVSTCMAALYLSSSECDFNAQTTIPKHLNSLENSPASRSKSFPSSPSHASFRKDNCTWTFHKEGVPVFVLDSGESRRQKRLDIVLAEKGTAFPLWREILTHLSQYRLSQHSDFHILNTFKNHSRRVGIHFYDSMSSNTFYNSYLRITNEGKDDVLDVSNNSRKKKKSGNKQSSKHLKVNFKKSDISQPCCFTHITKIEGADTCNQPN